MALDAGFANRKRIGNSLIGVSCGNQPQNFDFTRGQPVIRGVGSSSRGRYASPSQGM